MDTIIYIVIAIAIMAFQIYNEKKKKEQQAAAGLRKKNMVQSDENEIATFEKLFGLEMPDSAKQTGPEEVLSEGFTPEKEPVKPAMQTIQSVLDAQQVFNDNSQDDIYSSSEIYTDKFNLPEGSDISIKDEFNPKLFILYSELAKPKFLE